MNITFMIGNGFDVGLGLKTQYKDFYEYFIEKSAEDNIVKKWLIEAREGGTYDAWADLEKALGVHTKEISEAQSEEFIQSKIQMDILLSGYLKKEQDKIQLDDEVMKKIMLNALEDIRTGNNDAERLRISKTLETYRGEDYFYYGISFNYTNCFERFFEATKKPKPVIQIHQKGQTIYNETFMKIEYIHGTLIEADMILGVNDESQIENSQLADMPRIKRMLVKSELNISLGHNKINKVKNIINGSGIICIYGMSLGETDKMWWEILGKWLLNNPYAILIIFKYDLDYEDKHAMQRLDGWDEMKEHFMLQAGISEDKKQSISEQIVVYINKNIFEYRKDTLKQEKVG